MKKGSLINLNKTKCPMCRKALEFLWENSHGNRKIASCCGKEYWVVPSDLYKIEKIEDKEDYNETI